MAAQRAKTVVRLSSFEQASNDSVLYAHASRVFHLESNPGNARVLVQGMVVPSHQLGRTFADPLRDPAAKVAPLVEEKLQQVEVWEWGS